MGVQPVSLDGLIDFSLGYVKLQEILSSLLTHAQEQDAAMETLRLDASSKFDDLVGRLDQQSEEMKASGVALQASLDERLDSKLGVLQEELDKVKADVAGLDLSGVETMISERLEARCTPLEEAVKTLTAARQEDAKKLEEERHQDAAKLEEERQKFAAELAQLRSELQPKLDSLMGEMGSLTKEVETLSASHKVLESLPSDRDAILLRLKELEEKLEKATSDAAAAAAAAAASSASGLGEVPGDSQFPQSGDPGGAHPGQQASLGDKTGAGAGAGGECGPEATGSSTSTAAPSSLPGSHAGSPPQTGQDRPRSGSGRPVSSPSTTTATENAATRRPQTAEVSRRSISEGGPFGAVKEEEQAEIQDLKNSVDEVQSDAKRLAKELEMLAATVSGDCDSLAQFRAAHAMEVRRLEEGVRAARSDATGKSVAEKLSRDLALLNRRIDGLAGQLEHFSQRGAAAVSQCICCSTKMPAQENKILIGTDGKTYFRGANGRTLDIGRIPGAGPSNLIVPSRHGSAGQQSSKRGLLPKVPGMPHSASAGTL